MMSRDGDDCGLNNDRLNNDRLDSGRLDNGRLDNGRLDNGRLDNGRLDKWLCYCRFFKTRSLAMAAITGGKVHLNAERVKPAHRVRIGDRLSLSLQGIVAEFEVRGLPRRRGPAAEAQAHFLETAESARRRLQWQAQQRLAQLSRPRSDERPDKRDRRRLMRLHREQT